MRRFVPLRPKERGFAPESAQIAGFARGMRPHFLWERKWGGKSRVPSDAPREAVRFTLW